MDPTSSGREVEAVRIREAAPADAASVRRLATEFATSFVVDPQRFEATFPTLVHGDDRRVFVAEHHGEVVGYVLVFDHPTFYTNGPVGWVEELMVGEEVRGLGVGRSLMVAAEDWATSRGDVLIGLATRRAGSFYEAIGYEHSATFYRKLFPPSAGSDRAER